VGSGLKVDAPDKPAFNKEVKLAFPLPDGLPAKPTDAFFYVYRRGEGPNGRALFETVDHAFIECPRGKVTCAPEEQRVVTASFPFAGYIGSLALMDPTGAVAAASISYFYLLWT